MTVLSDSKIKEYLNKGKIQIVPSPDDIQIQPASVDLKLSDLKLSFDKISHIDTKNETELHYDLYRFSEDDPLILHPNDFVLTQTVEKVKLPDNILGRVEGRSSIGRLGVAIHITAGFIDPGFEGNITLEMANLGNVPVILYPNQRICQIVFEELDESCEKPYGYEDRNKYQGQSVPTPSSIFHDKI